MPHLTPQQKEAVNHDGNLLIVAGPGSGKTSTAVQKAKRILKDRSRSLVMVTFTREAAGEMRARLVAALNEDGLPIPGEERLVVATFHSIAIRHLRRHRKADRVLSPQAQTSLFWDAIQTVGVEREKLGEVQNEFERVMYSVDQDAVEVSQQTERVVARYRELLAATHQIDLYTVMRDCAIGAHTGRLPPLHFTDMLVDEGQDTDELQRLWIFAHARAGCRVTIVGDDDQSIYEWRNALGYKGMHSFLETFRAHRIDLGDNFRCRSEILESATHLIANNTERLAKRLVARRGAGGCIAIFRAGSSEVQNRTLAELIQSTPEQHTNAAVLARTNRSLDMLEIVLRASEVPYARLGKSIWDDGSIAGYLALLKTLIDGSSAGLLPVFGLLHVSPSVRSELLMALGGDVSDFMDGEMPSLNSMDATDKRTLMDLAKSCTYWRNQLRRTGAVREVILDVGDRFKEWTPSPSKQKLLDLCSNILADMRGTLSTRLQVVSRRERDRETPLLLMTMHAAKGLEFDTVHVVDANRVDDGSDVVRPEAERRLMYVAITRARDRMVLWHSAEAHPTLMETTASWVNSPAELAALLRVSGRPLRSSLSTSA